METEVRIYKALNADSFNNLGAYLLASGNGSYTFHPAELAITLTASMADINAAGCFIDNEGLDFHIEVVPTVTSVDMDAVYNPFASAHTLRGIIKKLLREQELTAEAHNNVIADYCNTCNDLKASIEDEKNQTKKYSDYWLEETRKNDRVKQQVQAISVLINSIFPS